MRLQPNRSLFLLLPLLASCSGLPAGASAQSADGLEMEVATVGMDLRTGAPLALLHADWEQVLPIWIGEVEAQAIALARQGIQVPRPQTHDLFTSVIDALGGALEEIQVHDLRDNTYYGVLRIRVGNEIREVDSRPSDALALAVRTGARITVSPHLIEPSSDVEFLSAHGERSIVRMRGITVSNPSEGDRQRLALPAEGLGVLVMHAEADLASRGVRRGDLILEVRGDPIETVMDFLEVVDRQPPTSSISMKVIRDGREVELDVPAPRPPGRVS